MPHIFCTCSCSGKGGAGGTVRKAKKPLMSSGASVMNSRYQRSTSPACSSGQSIGPAVDRADRMQPERERGDHAEVAAAAAHRPEQVGVLLGAGRDEAAVGQHHVGRQQVVDGQAVLARAGSRCRRRGSARRRRWWR